MSGLVADYGSDSSSAESDEETDQPEDIDKDKSKREAVGERLPLPSFSSELPGASVFSNPYRQAEEARRALLEKHVKLTTAPTELRQINGKQVCWNYRKGRCRFGRGCKFAHDSDLQRGELEESPGAPPTATETLASEPPPAATDCQPPRKKRPGLCETLAPGKKVMRMYNMTRKGPPV